MLCATCGAAPCPAPPSKAWSPLDAVPYVWAASLASAPAYRMRVLPCLGRGVARLFPRLPLRRVSQAAWAHAIEEVFEGKADGAPLCWPWSAGACVACLGILQDGCVGVDALPADGPAASQRRGRKRRKPTAAGEAGEAPPDTAPVPSGLPSRPPPAVYYPCIYPQLCDAVVNAARTR